MLANSTTHLHTAHISIPLSILQRDTEPCEAKRRAHERKRARGAEQHISHQLYDCA